MRSRDVTSGTAVRAAEQAAQVAREQAAVAAQIASQTAKEQAAQAAVLARNAAEKAVPKVSAAVEWASPRIEKGLLAAGPAVEAAAEKVVPAVDAARDRLVQDLLPRLVEAVNAAAAASATAERTAADKVSASLENAATAIAAGQPAPAASHRARRLLVFGTFAAAGAAGLAAWLRSRSTAPEWDALTTSEPAFTGGPEPTPSTLADPGPVASVPTSVSEQPQSALEPDSTPGTTQGDPILDGLGTSEATAAGTTSPEGATTDPVDVVDVVEVVEVEPAADLGVDDLGTGELGTGDNSAGETGTGDADAGDDPARPSGRRRKS